VSVLCLVFCVLCLFLCLCLRLCLLCVEIKRDAVTAERTSYV